MKIIMNEYRLNPGTQEFRIQQMEQNIFGEGSATPPDYIPPRQK